MRTTVLKEKLFYTEIHTDSTHIVRYIYKERIKRLKISIFQCVKRKRNFTKCHTVNGTLSESVFFLN